MLFLGTPEELRAECDLRCRLENWLRELEEQGGVVLKGPLCFQESGHARGQSSK